MTAAHAGNGQQAAAAALAAASVRADARADAPAGFLVELPAFAGPLDLLLTLIRDERLDIYDIPISRIAQQFLGRIQDLGLDEAADYLEMAARLLRIKAQMLLPRNEHDEAWEDPRAELVRRLLEYQQMREVVDVLERLGENRRNRFARSFVQAQAMPPNPSGARLALSLAELLGAVDRMLRTTRPPTLHEVVPRVLDVAGALDMVRSLLATRGRLRWHDVVARGAEPWEVLSALLALLEMAKLGEVKLAQRSPYADVEITRDAVSEAA